MDGAAVGAVGLGRTLYCVALLLSVLCFYRELVAVVSGAGTDLARAPNPKLDPMVANASSAIDNSNWRQQPT